MTSPMLDQLRLHASHQPTAPALQGLQSTLSYQALMASVADVASWISGFDNHQCVALAMDNTPGWIIADLALMQIGSTNVPLPAFFSARQKQHACDDAGVQLVLTDDVPGWQTTMPALQLIDSRQIAGSHVSLLRVSQPAAPVSACKVTYTSGTTGQPKGVCLDAHTMWQVADAIRQTLSLGAADRHCCVLPLATLLENVAGVYATLLAGGCVAVYPSAMVGFSGSQFEISRLYFSLNASAASTAILIPELLRALVDYVAAGHPAPHSLRFLAVGGARVVPTLLQHAQALGLPVFEGYGLSECASVVTLNTPHANKPGSIGRALPHVQMRVDGSGELWVKGSHLLGYTSAHAQIQTAHTDAEGYLPTGDLASQDSEGYWYIAGRKKNMFITSYGRNVSPEWVEAELSQQAVIMQCCLFGEAMPTNAAVLVVAETVGNAQIEHAVQTVNKGLPDYARIGRWVRTKQPFSPHNGQLTANGRLKRDAIWHAYHASIEALYMENV